MTGPMMRGTCNRGCCGRGVHGANPRPRERRDWQRDARAGDDVLFSQYGATDDASPDYIHRRDH